MILLSILSVTRHLICSNILSVTRHLICSQQLELASELESDIWQTVDWGKKWLADFSARKTQLVSCDRSNNTGSIM